MKSITLFLFCCIGICSAQVTTIIGTLTNNGGFEQNTNGWSFQSDSGQNKWVLGAVPTTGFSGGSCAFVSNSTSFPLNHQYTPTSSSITKLYRNVIFPVNTSNFNLKFKVLVQGNANDAKLAVYLLPTTTVLNVNVTNYGTPLATYQMQGTSWQDKSVAISNSLLNNSSVAVTKQLVFIWSNYSSSGAQPPAAIDDVTIDNCSAPTNITNVAAPAQLNLNWDSPDTAWEIRYKIDTATAWITANASSKPFVINGLPASTVYKVQIRNSNLTCTDWSAEFTTSTIPTNGSCANAIDIQGQDNINTVLPYIMNFNGAVLGAPTPQCGTTFNATAKEVWYKFTATTTRYIIDSSANIKAEVYEGNCGNLTFLTCKNGISYIENVVVGNQYYIRFISDSNGGNQINFRFLKSPQPPVNDLCVNALPLTNATGVSSNLTGSTFDTTPPLGNLYGNVLGDVWFTFVATENFASIGAGSQTAGPGSPSETLYISLYTGSCNNFVLFQNFSTFDNYSGGSTKNTNQLQIGTTYYVRVSSQSGMAENRIFGITVTAIASPINDDCSNAITVTINATGTTNVGGYYPFATPSTGLNSTCFLNGTRDTWYKFIATATKYLTSSGSYFVVYSGTCANLTPINCGINAVLNNLILGDTYYIRASDSIITFQEFDAADECVGSTILTPGVNPAFVYSSTINASSSNVPSICNSQTNDIWFEFVATSTKHRIETIIYSSGAFTIDLYFGACGTTLTQVPCPQISSSGYTTYKNLIIGQTYRLKVSRLNVGQFGVKVIYIFVEPNDEIQNATQIVPAVSGSPCSGYIGTMSGAEPSININNSCQQLTNNQNDVWYSFIATSDAYKLEFSSGNFSNIAIYKELNSNSIEIFSCGVSSFYGFTIGVKYFIRIVEFSTGAAPYFSFCISEISNRPVNDNCANAINVLTSTTTTCTNAYNADFTNCTYDQTNPISDSCVYYNIGVRNDIWYKFTATALKMLITNTLPAATSNGSATIRYTLFNNCNQLTCLNNGDYVEPSQKRFLNNLVIGTEYLIRMEKTSDPLSILSFCISTVPTITNDEIVNAKVLIPSSNLACSSQEINIINIATPSLTINATGCAANFNSYTSSQYNDRWYQFVATSNEHVLDFDYVPYGLIIQLFGGTTTNLICSGNTVINYGSSVSSTVFSGLVIGTVYYLRIIEQVSSLSAYGTYQFCLKTPLPIPVNDEYIGAINLIPSANLDTCNNTSSYFNRSTHTSNVAEPTCKLGSSCNEDVWFKFTATSPSHQLHIYNNNPAATNVKYFTTLYGSQSNIIQQELACFNPFAAFGSLGVPIEGINYDPITYQNYTNLTIGNTYYVRMYQFVDLSSYDFKIPVTFDVCLKTLPSIPVNNTIATAINISSNSTTTPQYIYGYTTRGNYLSNTTASTSGVNCYELSAFVIPGNAASNAWYKFTATQTSYQLNIINDANVLFPLTNVLTYSLYPLIVSLYQYDNTILKVKDCGLNAASNVIFNNLVVGKEYYIKLMYPAVTYFTDFEFQIGLSDAPLTTSAFEMDNSIILSPNPANEFLNIRIPNNVTNKTLEITNIVGQKVLNQQFNSEETIIDVSKFQAGTYLIKIKSESEETTSKFIKL